MLLDEGTCLFNFDPHQVSIDKSSVFTLFMLLIINLFMKGLYHVKGVAMKVT